MKQFCFTIFTILLVSSLFVPSYVISPKQQTESGISPLDVICMNNNVLVIRPSGDLVACVGVSSYQILEGRGWVAINDIISDTMSNHYVPSLENLINSIYLFEGKKIILSGTIYNNDIMIPLVECSDNVTDNNTNDSLRFKITPYKSDLNSSLFSHWWIGQLYWGEKCHFIW